MSQAALLTLKPKPTDADIDSIEDVRRCGAYYRIRLAIKQAAAG